ncbi:MAG: FecCD family ABC transporter permease [Akkermansiaceae bacterium]
MTDRSKFRRVMIMLGLTLACALITPWLGHQLTSPNVILRPMADDVDAIIFWQIRLPRILLSLLAGAGLSLGGVVFQALFRNPLATPFTLGVASGASLGVTLAIVTGIHFSLLGLSGTTLAALSGAIISIVLVYGIARATGKTSPSTMLLGGVAISFFFSSLILLLQYLSDPGSSFRVLHWLMGDLSRASIDSVLQLTPFVISGIIIVSILHRELNLLSITDDIAASRGVNVPRTQMLLFFAVSLMVAGIITVCGPIGFVGIMAPHICRLLIGPNHRFLIPASILFGASFLTLCDTLARNITSTAEVPVGIVTAILGGPFFLWLLLSKNRPAS